MKTRWWWLNSFLLLVLFLPGVEQVPLIAGPETTALGLEKADEEALRQQVYEAYGELPLYFIENQGQHEEQVEYYTRQGGVSIFFTEESVMMVLPEGVLRTRFLDSNPSVHISGNNRHTATFNYLIGNDLEGWHRDIPSYAEIIYHDLYPGVDLIYSGHNGALKYAFMVQPGADIHDIRLAYEGVDEMRVAENGDLLVTPKGAQEPIRDSAPIVYQEIDGERIMVESAFQIYDDHIYGFNVRDHNPKYPLVIDPQLRYSTFLGGWTSSHNGNRIVITLDDANNVYVVGSTPTSDFPTTPGAYDETHDDGYVDVFISVLDPTLSSLRYSTFLGGSMNEAGNGVVLDSAGNVNIVGTTRSRDFPTTAGAYAQTLNNFNDIFISVLDPTLSTLHYSTYLGSSGYDTGSAITLDDAGNVYITGKIGDTDFPTTIDAYSTYYSGQGDIFVSAFDPTLSTLHYSTLMGGSGYDGGGTISIDSDGSVYVAGQTDSSNLPTTQGAYDTSHNGSRDLFVSVFDPMLSTLRYSTFLGGSEGDYNTYAVLDSLSNIYITGWTNSSDFPATLDAYDGTSSEYSDAFVSVLDPTLSSLRYSTFLGGNLYDVAHSIVLDSEGNIYVTGHTRSSDFPVTRDAYDSTHNPSGDYDAFVSVLDSTLSTLRYSTFLGGSGSEFADVVSTLDSEGNIYCTGTTQSSDFPTTTGAYRETDENYGIFVSVLNPGIEPIYSISGHVSDSKSNPISDVIVSTHMGYTATSDSGGDYKLTNLVAGTYLLRAEKDGFDLSPSARIVRVPPDSTHQNFTTSPTYGSLTGKILDRASGGAIANARVSAGGQVNFTDENGNYALMDVLPGLHTLYVTVDGHESSRSLVVIDAFATTIQDVELSTVESDGFYLPYPGGVTYRCTQGNLNNRSHYGNWKYAFDFGMPTGHEVVAVQEGRIVDLKDDSNISCDSRTCIEDANYIRVRHPDGTATLYLHLDYKGVLVKKKQFVERGQPIARSDHTGYSFGPHLDITRHKWGQWNSIPMSFTDVMSDGIPVTGNPYTSGNYWTSSTSHASNIVTDTAPPRGSVHFQFTGQPTYTLQLQAADYLTNVTAMRLADRELDLQAASWLSFTTRTLWTNPAVFVQYQDVSGNISEVVSDTINAIGYEPLQVMFAVQPAVCVGQGLSITNQTIPFCEQCAWRWDFGNGTTSQEAEPEFDYVARSSFAGYASPGIYTVTLTAINAVTSSTVSHQVEALVAPSADFILIQSGKTILVKADDITAASWTWDFGDGVIATGQIVTHTYASFNNLDTYPVQLVTKNYQGCTSYSHQYLSIPPTILSVDGVTTGLTDEPYTFTTTVNTTATTPITYTWAFDAHSIVSHTGSISDTVAFSWATPGSQAIVVTATNIGGTITNTHNITIYTPIDAAFTASPTIGPSPLSVDFTNTSTGSYATSLWAFGDGITSTIESPKHTYTRTGVYTVSLVVTGSGGSDTIMRSGYITVFEGAHADFTAVPISGTRPLTVNFTNTSIGDYNTSLWDFGDGITSTIKSPTHVYQNMGTYTVTLTIDGNGGQDMVIRRNYITVERYHIYLPLTIRSYPSIRVLRAR